MFRLLPKPGSRSARIGAAGVVVLVAALSLMPNLSVPDEAPRNTDLLIHLLMQGALGASVLYGWPRCLSWVALAMTALVVGLEVGQLWVPGREFSASDLLANTFGAGLGGLLGLWAGRAGLT